MMDRKNYKYERALILSGGGSFGAYHIGVLQYLEEINWRPDIVCGTSVGSIISSLLCSGYSSNEIKELFLQLNHKDFFSWQLLRFLCNRIASTMKKSYNSLPSLSSALPLRKTLDKFISIEKIRSNAMKLYISAAQISTNQLKIFGNDEITTDHILASCAIPMIYPPVQIDNHFYWDGGMIANVPLLPIIENKCKEIIIVKLFPGTHTSKSHTLPTSFKQAKIQIRSELMGYPFQILEFLQRQKLQAKNTKIFPLQFNDDMWKEKSKHNLNIQILMPQSNIYTRNALSLSKKQASQLINEGYVAAKEKLPPFLKQS